MLSSKGVKREGYSQEDGWEMGRNRPKPNSIMYQGLFQQNLPEKDLTMPLLPPATLQASNALAKILLPEESPPAVSLLWHYFRSRAYTANATAEMTPTAGRMYSRDRPLPSPFGTLA